MKKNKGYALIETMISIMIIITLINVCTKAYIDSVKSFKYLALTENLKMALYNIGNELKYNLSKEEIEMLFLKENQICLKYDKDINKRLMYYNLKDMEKGYDIKIISKDDNYEEFIIEAIIPMEESDIVIKEIINKSWWMNEIL